MKTPTRLGAYVLGLIAVFGVAAGVGSAIGPIRLAGSDDQHGGTHDPSRQKPDGHAAHDKHDAGGDAGAKTIPGGVMISADGYTLSLTQDIFQAGEAIPITFRVLGSDGQPVTDYAKTHDKDLHLIAVRRDMTGFQHVHPELGAGGTWKTSLSLTPGEWRMFADFTPAGYNEALTLGADIAVAGEYSPRPLPEPDATAQVDGYTVTRDGELVPGRATKLTLTVSRDGRAVTDLQPYLAAYGHLVALRDGDLAYLHVHPAGEPGDGTTQPGPEITFYATAPSAGDYRLFLDFKHEGVVRTAEFTARAE